jgi:hypothetical protein
MRGKRCILRDLGSFSKGDINVWDSLKIHSTEQGIKKTESIKRQKLYEKVYFESFTFTAFIEEHMLNFFVVNNAHAYFST